jgi:casein kinase 1
VIEDIQYEVRVAGRFRMGKKIGSGSFGEIFLALDLQTNKEVAVKFVSERSDCLIGLFRIFFYEIQIL